MSIQAKHVEGTLNTKVADSLLRDIWPAGMRGARSFGEWREEREKGRLVALTTYVTTTVQSADALCNGSGMVNAVLVSRLARDRPATTTGAMHWTVRGELDDIEYIRAARAEAAKHGATGLVHRLGGGKDLGFVRKDPNLRATGPHLWVARAPIWWTAEDLAGFLCGAGWSDVTIVGRHQRAWRFRAAERPADNTAYMYEVGEDTLSVVLKQRKASARETGRALARPTLPWAEADRQKEQQKRDEEVRAMEVDAVKSGDDGSRTDGDKEARDGTEGGSALRDDGDGTAVATEQGKLGPAAKRQKTDDKVGDGLQAYFREEELQDKLCPLVGYRAVEAGGAGACGYVSIALAARLDADHDATAGGLPQEQTQTEGRTLRAKAAQALRSSRTYKGYWAADPEHPEFGDTYEAYCDHVEKPDFWIDELQMTAVAGKIKRRIVVVYRVKPKTWAVRLINERAGNKRPLVLLLTDGH